LVCTILNFFEINAYTFQINAYICDSPSTDSPPALQPENNSNGGYDAATKSAHHQETHYKNQEASSYRRRRA
jgi:hypothetical protein